ncbi:MAG: trypsin-like serine protease [Flavobacteriales bacterium]|jgi:S1-C subfamily serine protease|nr:trypsin-like serine protease [Flavobacteriales bacterium]
MYRLFIFSFFLFYSTFSFSQDYTELAKNISNATVQVIDGKDMYVGSGFICEGSDYIVTNYHVVELMKDIYIRLDKDDDKRLCKIIKYDKEIDLAILSLYISSSTIFRNRLKISNEKTTVGKQVFSCGYPMGIFQFSNGIISNNEEHNDIVFIQHTAPISQGNSGGPLVNSSGRVIGINTLIHSKGENMAFAIPIKHAVELLKKTGENIKVQTSTNTEQEYDHYINHSDISNNKSDEDLVVINHMDGTPDSDLTFLDYLYGFLLLCVFLILLYIIFVE